MVPQPHQGKNFTPGAAGAPVGDAFSTPDNYNLLHSLMKVFHSLFLSAPSRWRARENKKIDSAGTALKLLENTHRYILSLGSKKKEKERTKREWSRKKIKLYRVFLLPSYSVWSLISSGRNLCLIEGVPHYSLPCVTRALQPFLPSFLDPEIYDKALCWALVAT